MTPTSPVIRTRCPYTDFDRTDAWFEGYRAGLSIGVEIASEIHKTPREREAGNSLPSE